VQGALQGQGAPYFFRLSEIWAERGVPGIRPNARIGAAGDAACST